MTWQVGQRGILARYRAWFGELVEKPKVNRGFCRFLAYGSRMYNVCITCIRYMEFGGLTERSLALDAGEIGDRQAGRADARQQIETIAPDHR